MALKTYNSLKEFLNLLELNRSLVHITETVDPHLVAPALAVLTFRRGGPAFIVDKPDRANLPLAMNIFGRKKHIEWALGRPPEQIGVELLKTIQDLQPPSLAKIWKHRSVIKRALAMRSTRPKKSPLMSFENKRALDALPITQSWEGDSGPFITWPMVLTTHPVTGGRNLGTYRLQKNNAHETGMHWQIQKGAGFHYYEAEKLGQPLPVAVLLGSDPVLMIASILPLPEDMDEIAFAGYLRGKPVPMTRGRHVPFAIPASAEIVLEGVVPPSDRKEEGPFGDHFGHYSRREKWPVFHISSVSHRPDAVYPATIVGPPPLEDGLLGDAVQEMLSPLLRLAHPEVRSLWSYMETGFHGLAVAAVTNRYNRESKKAGLALLGEGQFSLTKCLVLVDERTDPRDIDAVLRLFAQRFDPASDFLLIPETAYDSLDFTSAKTHHGSKMLVDLSIPRPERDLSNLSMPDLRRYSNVGKLALYGSGVLVFQTQSRLAKPLLAELLKSPDLGRVKLVVAVSEDIDPADRTQMLWGWFTRFEPARDIMFEHASMRGAVPHYGGAMGIDATFKSGYPDPLKIDPESNKEAERLWDTYLK